MSDVFLDWIDLELDSLSQWFDLHKDDVDFVKANQKVFIRINLICEIRDKYKELMK